MTREESIHFATCLKNNWTINFADMEDFCDMAIEALSMQTEMMDEATLLVKHEGWEDIKRIFLTGEAGLFGRYFYAAEQMEKMEKGSGHEREQVGL